VSGLYTGFAVYLLDCKIPSYSGKTHQRKFLALSLACLTPGLILDPDFRRKLRLKFHGDLAAKKRMKKSEEKRVDFNEYPTDFNGTYLAAFLHVLRTFPY